MNPSAPVHELTPAEGLPVMRIHSTTFRLVSTPSSAPAARRRIADLASAWGLHLDDTSRLTLTTVTSELVTNALQHSGAPSFTVKVTANWTTKRVLIEVHDNSPELPRLLNAHTDAEDGRGMWLVDQLAITSGADPMLNGKRVWAECALQTADCRSG